MPCTCTFWPVHIRLGVVFEGIDTSAPLPALLPPGRAAGAPRGRKRKSARRRRRLATPPSLPGPPNRAAPGPRERGPVVGPLPAAARTPARSAPAGTIIGGNVQPACMYGGTWWLRMGMSSACQSRPSEVSYCSSLSACTQQRRGSNIRGKRMNVIQRLTKGCAAADRIKMSETPFRHMFELHLEVACDCGTTFSPAKAFCEAKL